MEGDGIEVYMRIKNLIKKIIYGYKADSDSYINYLLKCGYSIGTGCKYMIREKQQLM